MLFSIKIDHPPWFQVVYAVANEGSRLEIPEGPLGRLISGFYCIYFLITQVQMTLKFHSS